jgi:nicotinamide riboside transporter PnuC
MSLIGILEWSGTFSGLLGALLLATHTSASKYGWIAFLVADITMGCFAFKLHHYGLLVQQLGFASISLLGIYRSGLFRQRLLFIRR